MADEQPATRAFDPRELLDIDGVFFAVKCVVCDTVYAAESDEYLAFWGSVTAGLEQAVIGVAAPRKPAKRAVAVVCRDPRCVSQTVKKMLGADGSRGNADALWAQVLKIWSEDAGHTLVEKGSTPATAASTTASAPAPQAPAPEPAPTGAGAKKRA